MSDNIRVSDHAIIRYLERYYKLDIEKIKQEILTSEHKSAIKSGAKRIKVNGIELKDSYFKQAKINLELAKKRFDNEKLKQEAMF